MQSNQTSMGQSSADTAQELTTLSGCDIHIAVPMELELYRHDIRRFLDAIIYKLKKNAHKGRWEGAKIRDYIRKLKDEVAELEDAIAGENHIEIILEAADVANFAMIISSMATENGE